MTPREIMRALGERLLSDGLLPPIMWPNQHGQPQDSVYATPANSLGEKLPFLAVDYVPVSRTDPTVAGEQTIARGYIVVSVMAASGGLTGEADEIAQRVMALFPKGFRFAVPGGDLVVIKPAEDLPGFPDRDGAAWRLPVRIDFEAAAHIVTETGP